MHLFLNDHSNAGRKLGFEVPKKELPGFLIGGIILNTARLKHSNQVD